MLFSKFCFFFHREVAKFLQCNVAELRDFVFTVVHKTMQVYFGNTLSVFVTLT